MKNHFVVDTSVYITYAAYNKIYRLADAVIRYQLAIFINQHLLNELEKNIPDALRVANANTGDILEEIKATTVFVDTIHSLPKAPIPKIISFSTLPCKPAAR